MACCCSRAWVKIRSSTEEVRYISISSDPSVTQSNLSWEKRMMLTGGRVTDWLVSCFCLDLISPILLYGAGVGKGVILVIVDEDDW